MRVVLLGPPGAGKGTQAVQLAEKLEVPHLSTGDLFRENIGNGTKLGLEAKRYLDAGDLVPSELTNELVDDRLSKPDTNGGFILDGYPRSVQQAKALHDMLERRGTALDAVLEFRVPEDVLFERLRSRGRADDTDDVIHNRMNVYRDETAPLIEYYTSELKTVDAVGSVDEVFARALQGPREVTVIGLAGLRSRKVVPQRSAAELDAMAAAGAVVAAALACGARGRSSRGFDARTRPDRRIGDP